MHADQLKFYKYSPVKKPIYKGKFCGQPFNRIQIDNDGDVMLCDCQLHMPYVIGNIFKNSLQEIWLGKDAQDVRQSVLDEEFTYCNWSCASLPRLPDRPSILPILRDFPRRIKLDLDLSCNLKCVTCREQVIIEKNSEKIAKQIELYNEIIAWGLANPDNNIIIEPVSSGEIFASHSGLKFLQSLTEYPYTNLQLHITTNGTLIKKNQKLISSIQHLITEWSVSLDAATPETYDIVRGGVWDDVLFGLELIKSYYPTNFTLRFCIQKNNYHEIEAFVDLAQKFNASINFQKLLDWGHWTIQWWHDNNVFDRTRATFDQALESLIRAKRKYGDRISMASELIKYLEKFKEHP